MRPRLPVLAVLLAVPLLAGGLAAIPPAIEPIPVHPPAAEAAKRERRAERPAPAAAASPPAAPTSTAEVTDGTDVSVAPDGERAGHANAAKGKADRKKSKQKKNPKTCFGERRTIADQRGDIQGTAGADVIIGDDKKNSVAGNGGEDRICLGKGNDFAFSGSGVVVTDPMLVSGGPGNDFISGGAGANTIAGGDGDDDLSGGVGGNTIAGGPGNDDVFALGGDDDLSGGPGNDRVTGFGGSDRMDGGPGNDSIFTGNTGDTTPDGVDTVFGGPGNDEIRAADGARDIIDCGSGNDTLEFDPGLDSIVGGCETES